ncbi:MAG: hypothetical protein ACOCRK_03065 [bacterium]
MDIYKEVLKRWGIASQFGMTVEEIGELLQAINKYRRGLPDSYDNICEEIADVEIMLETLKEYFSKVKIESYKKKKLKKLKRMLKDN